MAKAGALFSGLVKGLGTTLLPMHQQAQQRKFQQEQDERQIALSALMNDPNLPGSARRIGLVKLGLPPDLVEYMVPDVPVETGEWQNVNPVIPQGGMTSKMSQPPPPEIPKMPSRPPEAQMGNDEVDPFGAPAPRNPLVQPPQVLETLPNQPGERAAPVMAKYSGGLGAKIDELDMKIAAARDALRNSPMGRRPITRSSLGMSRADMDMIRRERQAAKELDRQMQLDQVQGLLQQRNALETATLKEQFEQANIAPHLKAEVDSMEQVLGRPLTAQEKQQKLGLMPSGPMLERSLEAQDIEILEKGDPNSAEYKAALRRKESQDLVNQVRKTQIASDIARIKKGTNFDDPVSYSQFLSKVKFQADNLINKHFGGQSKVTMINERTEEILKENPHPLATLADPLLRKSAARRMAKEDVESRMENLKAKYQLALENEKEPVSVSVVGRLYADQVRKHGNKVSYADFVTALEQRGYAIIDER